MSAQHILPTYYALKNPSNLPPGANYTDPYDMTKFVIQPGETLSSLIKKIVSHRETQKAPEVDIPTLRVVIETFLYDTTADNLKSIYFKEEKHIPTVPEVISFAKIFSANFRNTQTPSLKTQKYRARSCLSCPLHRANAAPKSMMFKVAESLLGTKNLFDFDEKSELTSCGACGCGLQSKIQEDLTGVVAALDPSHVQSMVSLMGSKAYNQCWILRGAVDHPTLKAAIAGKSRAASPATNEAYQRYVANPLAYPPTDKDGYIHPLNDKNGK